MKRDSRKTFFVEKFSELSDEYQRRVRASGISEELADANFEILLNVLHFKTKNNFYTQAMYEVKDKYASRRYNKGHSLIDQSIVSVASFTEEYSSLLTNKPEFKIEQTQSIGRGGFGEVFLSHTIKEKIPIAIKRMPHLTLKQKRKNCQEIRFLLFCNGKPNILQFRQAILEQERGEVWVATEYLEGGTLTQAVSTFTFHEPHIVYVVKQVLSGLAFLHKNFLAHRDLKSANIMLTVHGEVKLIDFGLCSDISQGEVVHMVGSPFWMPPEMIKRLPHGLSTDVWSFGICCMEMANGHVPNRKSSIAAMFISASDGYPMPFEEPEDWTDEFNDFIMRCLRCEPTERWSVPQLLEHPFLAKCATKEEMVKIFVDIYKKDKTNTNPMLKRNFSSNVI
jgi:serine/threonine protein kinase